MSRGGGLGSECMMYDRSLIWYDRQLGSGKRVPCLMSPVDRA